MLFKGNPFLFKFYNKCALQYEEELIFFIMLMPMELSFFKDPNPHYTIIYLAQRLIKPIIGYLICKGFCIYQL